MSPLAFKELFDRLHANIERYIVGKSEAVRLALICMLAQGHLLVQDVPGVAKTSLAKAIAGSIRNADCQRVQFTPDLLPSDVTGAEVFNSAEKKFYFRRGPVFANVLIGDEINRASPKTQSALLQAMAEREVTAGLITYPLPDPFFCVATQNPIEHRGTYQLPEAQLDRFLMRVSIGYPGLQDEKLILRQGIGGFRPEGLESVVSRDQIVELIAAARHVRVAEPLEEYLVQIIAATRTAQAVQLGISPRGAIALARAAQVSAAAQGRGFATPDDVKFVALPVMAHRLVLTQEASLDGQTEEKVLQEIIDSVLVPRRPGLDR